MAARDTASLLAGLLFLCHTCGVWAGVVVNMEDRVEVFRGQTAQITCMFTSNDGDMFIQWFYLTWTNVRQRIYYDDTNMQVIDQGTPYTNRISVNSTGATGGILLTINNVKPEDEVEFVCTIRVGNETGSGSTKLKVFEKPGRPTIEAVPTGISVNQDSPSKIGTCEVKNGYPKPNINWYRNNTPLRGNQDVVKVVQSITTETTGLISVMSQLNMKVVKEDKDDQFYCEITYFVPGGLAMTETNRINITVIYPSTAVNIWVESPKDKIKEGDSVEFYCHGNGNRASIFTISHDEEDYQVDNNMMVIKNVTRQNSGVYVCTSLDTDSYDVISGNTTIFVHYLDSAVVSPKDTVLVAQGDELTATCNALSSLQTHTVWLKDGEKPLMGHTLTRTATFDSAGKYTCVVTVPEIEGMETRATLTVNVQGPPHITEPDLTMLEETLQNTVDLSCHVKGFPHPDVVWTTSDGKVIDKVSQTTTDKGIESKVSILVTSNIKVFCNASNEFGTAAVTFDITAKSNGVIIAVIIICILLLAVLGSVLYFLYKKGKICGRSGKQDLTKEKSGKDNIVVEMKSDNKEEAVLLGVNGEKQPPSDQ